MKTQSTFNERLARIESQTTFGGGDAYQVENLVQEPKRQRRLHWDMLAVGGVAGGIIGTLFAMKVGLLLVIALDATTLYQLVLADYTQALLMAGVAAAPFGFVMSQIFARRNPRGWQFWIGYLAGVVAANASDIHTFYYILTTPAA
ncbi:hypothetical protein [Tateyamaria sp. SN3-11]|uniref:hypothetical protein n=1 Tax=Tateyamaria sp. SN3-11 TaxID=3092147 RepID=UPI0039E86C50